MAHAGFIALIGAFCLTVLSAVCLFAGGRWYEGFLSERDKHDKGAARSRSERLVNAGYLGVFGICALLTVALIILLVGFFTANFTMKYVAQNYPNDPGPLQWMYIIAGVWGGREGSLFFWTWLISLISAFVAYRRLQFTDRLTTYALAITSIIIAAFLGTMIFSQSNNPFQVTPAHLINDNGKLIGSAALWGMNKLLEHWAMVLHPPLLFMGYAGLTLPCAYALAALLSGDLSRNWINLSQRLTLCAWMFLTMGIGLGAVWAYVVLGWGGYWGWDAVENASFLSWLTSTALLHSMTAYKRRSTLKLWSLVLAAASFIFVVLGTFITRSGIVQSVHAFSQDPVSTTIFLVLMVTVGALTVLGLVWRSPRLKDAEDFESLISKNASYFMTNVILLACAALLAYMTLAPALPAWLPLGGSVVGAGAYNLLARPIGILFLLLAAVCPFLSWVKTDKDAWKFMRIPLAVSVVLFAVCLWYTWAHLIPIYQANITGDPQVVATTFEQGPFPYYVALTVLGFFAGCLLLCNSCYLVIKGISQASKHVGGAWGGFKMLITRAPGQFGGYLIHASMGILLIGLIGSAMYVQERVVELDDKPGTTIDMGAYSVTYNGVKKELLGNGDAQFSVSVSATHGSGAAQELTPSITMPQKTGSMGQQFLHAAVSHHGLEDLFIAFQGYDYDGKIVLTVKVNPLIGLVWAGFILMVLSALIGLIPARHATFVRAMPDASPTPQACAEQG